MVLYWPNFSLMFLIHLFLYAGVYCIQFEYDLGTYVLFFLVDVKE